MGNESQKKKNFKVIKLKKYIKKEIDKRKFMSFISVYLIIQITIRSMLADISWFIICFTQNSKNTSDTHIGSNFFRFTTQPHFPMSFTLLIHSLMFILFYVILLKSLKEVIPVFYSLYCVWSWKIAWTVFICKCIIFVKINKYHEFSVTIFC